jgi:hypothetical protein
MSSESYQLTKYDDFPVHQASYPFSYTPSTDLGWDEGYMFAAVNPKLGLYFMTGFRITPNVDTIGVHAGLNRKGLTRTLRLSREWRRNFDTIAGPYKVDFTEPMKEIHLTLGENPAGLKWDVRWIAVAPAHVSTHHLATQHGRRTTDQTRYNQVGRVEGWVEIDGGRIDMSGDDWLAIRDHSWGIYEGRPPFGGHVLAKYMPPPEIPAVRRAIRFSVFFRTEAFSGYFHLHEDENGRQVLMNDAFGTPFEGVIDFGWNNRLELKTATHKLVFAPGTRSMQSGDLEIEDMQGGRWKMSFLVTAPPYVIIPTGYHQGSWKDGGNIHTYHGPDNPYMEWDEFDFSNQPAEHTLYGETEPRRVYGVEHLGTIEITSPDGTIHRGNQHTEIFLNGKYTPYGFEAPVSNRPHGLVGRGIL